jgi:hypothetical protein
MQVVTFTGDIAFAIIDLRITCFELSSQFNITIVYVALIIVFAGNKELASLSFFF